MLKKVFISLIISMVFCFTSLATPYITVNSWRTNDDYQHHCSVQGINKSTGEVVWNTYLGSKPSDESSGGTYLGENNGYAYVVFNGSVYLIDPETGNIIFVNSDFQGWDTSWAFSSSGKLYMCGWEGPDLFIMGSDGHTISRVETLTNNQYCRPYSLYFTSGNNIAISYEGGIVDGATLQFDVTKYFGVKEGIINNASTSSYNSNADSIIGKYVGVDKAYYNLEIYSGDNGSLKAVTYLTSGGYEHSILSQTLNKIDGNKYRMTDSEQTLTIHKQGSVDIDGTYYQKYE